LSGEDCQLLLDALVTLASIQNRLASHDVTIHKLRKLLGIEKSSEKQTDVIKKSQKTTKRSASIRHNDEGFTIKSDVGPTSVLTFFNSPLCKTM
jgi:transposase